MDIESIWVTSNMETLSIFILLTHYNVDMCPCTLCIIINKTSMGKQKNSILVLTHHTHKDNLLFLTSFLQILHKRSF